MPTKPRDSFTVLFYGICGLLTVLCLVFAVLSMRQGYRIRASSIDTARVTQVAGQRLVLRLNQPSGTVPSKQVRLSPATPVSVLSSGNTLIVQFGRPLLNDTAYTVSVVLKGNHSLRYHFRTAPAQIYYVERLPDMDIIHRRTLEGRVDTAVYQAVDITNYAVLADMLIVQERQADGTDHLTRVPFSGAARPLPLAGTGTIDDLQASPDKRTFGFTFTQRGDASALSRLLLCNVTTSKITTLKGLDGKALSVLDWRYAPDGRQLALQAFDSSILVANVATGRPTPLGQFSYILGFTADSQQLLVAHPGDGKLLVDIMSLERKPFLAYPLEPAESFLSAVLPLPDSGYVLQTQVFGDGASRQAVLLDRDSKRQTIFRAANPERIVTDLTVLGNGHYATIQTSEQVEGLSVDRIHVINLISRQELGDFRGIKVRW